MNRNSVAHRSMDWVREFGRAGMLLARIVVCIFTTRLQWRPLFAQIHFIGASSLLVIIVSGLFVGMVVALQFYDTLVRFGSTGLLGSAVGLSLLRELGPVLTALVVIGRVGSSVCAEIGMMRYDNQIDALECMAIDPVRYLLVPRVLGAMISIPMLMAIFIVVGIFGGYVVGVHIFGESAGAYFNSMAEAILLRDQLMCLYKALIFAVLIIWICTSKGYFLHLTRFGNQGPSGVSRVTTDAVVASSIGILFADYLISALVL
ncbi:MAG: MlaE family ABC transporter permease [Candidatus Eutrophobiaceae bacterium]